MKMWGCERMKNAVTNLKQQKILNKSQFPAGTYRQYE